MLHFKGDSTGFKDKNGEPIKNGDVLLTDENGWVATVSWQEELENPGENAMFGERYYLEDDDYGYSLNPNWGKCVVLSHDKTLAEVKKERGK